MVTRKTAKTRIYELAEEVLAREPDGINYTRLNELICELDQNLNPNTVKGTVWNAPDDSSNSISKRSRGLYVHSKFDGSSRASTTNAIGNRSPRRESDFYSSLAEWMERDIEEVTKAVELGGSHFRGKWGTPDVIGKKESKTSDIYQMQMEFISAEVKTDPNQLVTAFGQACAYCLFSHRSYLVVPKNAAPDELDRLTSLCQVFGIGLVFFDADCVQEPDYSLKLRARRQEPDYLYLNEVAAQVKDKLW